MKSFFNVDENYNEKLEMYYISINKWWLFY